MADPAAPTDELDAMFARLATGDRTAIARCFQVSYPMVHRFCSRLLGSGADADDATQQALKQVFERASTYDPSRRALPWVLEIATWEVRTIRRRGWRTSQRQVAEVDEHITSELVDPETTVMSRQVLSVLEELTSSLSESERDTLRQIVTRELGLGPETGSDATYRKRKERVLTKVRSLLRNLGHVQ